MEQGLVWLNVLIVVLVVVGVGLYLYARASQRARLMARAVSEVQRRDSQTRRRDTPQVSQALFQFLRGLDSKVPLLSVAQRTEVSQKLVAAGYRSHQSLYVMMGLMLLCALLMLGLFAWLTSVYLDDQGTLFRVVAGVAVLYIGSLLPRLVLDRMVLRRQAAIRQSLPDALDLLVICTNAGLALNAALERVADELEVVAPQLADELKLTSIEMKLSSDIEPVLNGLAQRTDIDGMRSLVTTFLQARQYGTAITQALRILASSERTARMMRLEEQAAKLSVKMTIPMILFILPTVIMVSVGPAILNLIKVFSNM